MPDPPIYAQSVNVIGPTVVAFETTGPIPNQEFGVSVQGATCGVCGQGTPDHTLNGRKAPAGTGVLGRGRGHGVYGISDTIGVDKTPDFSDTGRVAIAVVGVNQGSDSVSDAAPAVLGSNGVTKDLEGTPVATPWLEQGASLPVGVEGISLNGLGMLGIALGPVDAIGPKPEFDAAVDDTVVASVNPADHTAPQSSWPPAGVLGLSVLGIGIRGASRLDRGGVFESSTARLYPSHIDVPVRAQIRLVPHAAVAQSRQVPTLPKTGQAGDLLCVNVTDQNHTERATLWFCERGGMDARTGPAVWRSVTLGDTVAGTDP
jgi:hypothetical protein